MQLCMRTEHTDAISQVTLEVDTTQEAEIIRYNNWFMNFRTRKDV